MAADKEWARNGSFMKKPESGWLHKNSELTHGDGVYYPVSYVGSMPLVRSMRDLDFDDRTLVTREAITQIAEIAGLKPERQREVKHIVRACLNNDPVAKNLRVKLTISTSGIALVTVDPERVIANHGMPNISFATGGDAEDYDLIGYVAKDSRGKRECHVFDCGHMAADIIATVGQAFELRYKAFLAKSNPSSSRGGGGHAGAITTPSTYGDAAIYDEAGVPEGDAVYDDLPQGGEVIRSEALYGDDSYGDSSVGQRYVPESTYDSTPGAAQSFSTQSLYGDDSTDPTYDTAGSSGAPSEYNGSGVIYDSADADGVVYDPAGDTLPDYDEDLSAGGLATDELQTAPGGDQLERPLDEEPWFHTEVDRMSAETMLQNDGDFLVRESLSYQGQYILTALQDGVPMHLLLVDPQGRVRTRDMAFVSPSHLINYHLRSQIPIISRGSSVTLGNYIPFGGEDVRIIGGHMYGDH